MALSGSFLLFYCVAMLPALSLATFSSSAASFVHGQTSRHVYGRLYIRGFFKGLEYYRATFGGMIPCGSRDIVISDDGCTPASFGEGSVGRFAVVQRGNCTFVTKALFAQRAGAAGLIVINNEPGLIRPPMGNVSDALEVVIPVVMVPQGFMRVVEDARKRAVAARTNFPNLHGTLGPARELCVNPQEHDAEWFMALANDTLPRSAHPISRVKPGGVPAGGSSIPEEIMLSRMPGIWPAAPTEVGMVTISVSMSNVHLLHPEAEARVSTLGTVEVYLALFGGSVLGDEQTLAFPKPLDGCSPPTSGSVNGSIAVVVRGSCAMIDKARILQAAGAVGVFIINAQTSSPTATAALAAAGQVEDEGAGLPVGMVQAIPDAAEEENPVLIPVGMISAQDAASWSWMAADGSHADLTGCSASWTASTASGGAWEDLTELRSMGTQAWPADAYHVRQKLVSLVLAHHPSSATGHARRWAHLTQTAQKSGLTQELTKAANSITWLADGTGEENASEENVWHPGSATSAPGLALGSPASLHLIAGLKGTVLETVVDGPLRCRSQSGSHYNVPLTGPVDASSPYSLSRRVLDLLAVQACLEKVALVNAAAIGGYMELLRKDSEARDWPVLLRSLISVPYGMSDSDSLVAANTYIALGRAVREVMDGEGRLEHTALQKLFGPGEATASSNATSTVDSNQAGTT